MEKKIAVIKGDGIGPEIVDAALGVLAAAGDKFGHRFVCTEVLAGGAAIDATGECLPAATMAECRASDAVLLGAVGGPKWDALPGPQRPEKALLGLRSGLGLFCNLRPVLDLLIVRELTGGVYFGAHERSADGQTATDVMSYSVPEVERIARMAFAAARTRAKRVTSVDKANVLETSRLWRETVERVAREYPDVALDHMYVDNAAMQLIRNPKHFDVLLTENMFGDILSDEASQIAGSIGLLPSASLRADGFGMYEPIHGSAPDIAGRDLANPLATILSAAMMLRHSFGLEAEAAAVEKAVEAALADGLRTADLAKPGEPSVGARAMGEAVRSRLLA